MLSRQFRMVLAIMPTTYLLDVLYEERQIS